jgi:hypothetical protein
MQVNSTFPFFLTTYRNIVSYTNSHFELYRGSNSVTSSNSTSATILYDEKAPETSITLSGIAQSKFYNFDHVFDKNASQETIYEKVASPIIKEVLKG